MTKVKQPKVPRYILAHPGCVGVIHNVGKAP